MKYLIMLLVTATMVAQKPKSKSVVVTAIKAGFGWQVGKNAGNDAYKATKEAVKKEIDEVKKKRTKKHG